jgi:hypothetical protein
MRIPVKIPKELCVESTMFALAAHFTGFVRWRERSFPIQNIRYSTTSEKPSLTSENRENLATGWNCKAQRTNLVELVRHSKILNLSH